MGSWELRDWTHKFLPEWTDPDGSSREIQHELVLKILGNENAEEYAEEIVEMRRIDSAFASLRE